MHAEKNKAVGELTGGIEYLFKKNKIDWLKGHAAFQNSHTVEVSGKSYTARNIVIATGSSVKPLPGVEIDGAVIVDSRSEEHTYDVQSLMRNSYAVFCLEKRNQQKLEQHLLSSDYIYKTTN